MCPCFVTLALLAIVVILVYVFLVWNFGYWKKRGVKEAKSLPLLGSFPNQYTQKRNVVYDVDDLYKKYKNDENFLGVYNSRTPQLLILSPEHARKVFVNDFRSFHDNEFSIFISKKVDVILGNNPFILTGEEWKERRADITPGLTLSRVKSVYPVTQKVCKSFTEYIWQQSRMAPKEGLNGRDICLRFTTELVSDCVLGIKAMSFSDHPLPIFDMTKKVFEQSLFFNIYSAIANLVPQLRCLYMPRFFSKEVETFFFDIMKSAIELRRQKKDDDRADFLNYMLQLQERKQLTTMEIMSNTMTFLTDGFETTASVLAHTLLLLGRYPKTQEKLRREIEDQSAIDFDALTEQLPYLDACLHEAIRLFAPQLVARKICTAPCELVNKNGQSVRLEVGTVVQVPIYCLHHDPEIYENPEDFVPERFLEENGGVKRYREMGAYYGFGDGPRMCIGMRFALVQMKSALVEIIRDFNVKVNPKTRKDNYLDMSIFMGNLDGGIWLDFEPRN